MRLLATVIALAAVVTAAQQPAARQPEQQQITISGALQQNFNDLLTEIRELGEEFGLKSQDKHVADATPLVLLVGGYSTGKSSLVNNLMNCTKEEIQRGICQRVSLAPEDDKITFLVYNEKGMHVEPIKLIEAQLQGLIHVPHGILSKPELMDRSYVKLLNKPILKEMTLIDTPGITANDWSGVIEDHIALLAKHATKILFLVNDMHAGVNHKANLVLSTILDCCSNDVEMLFTMPNKFESLNDMIRAQNNWNREMGKIRQQDKDMHQNMQTLYFPDLKWSAEEQKRVIGSSKVPLNEFRDAFETLQLKLKNAVALHWQKTLSSTLDLLVLTEMYVTCLSFHQTTWSGKFGGSMSSTLPQCLKSLYDNESKFHEIPNMKRITDKLIELAEQSRTKKRVTPHALDRLAASRRTWYALREQVKDATCQWAQGVEDAFYRLSSKSGAASLLPAWSTTLVCLLISVLLAGRWAI